MLNAISAVGLLTMIALAWLMSSHKRKVDWRLVVLGVLLQLALAAVFFNSQNWKFPREFTDLPSLVTACDQEGFDPSAVPQPKEAKAFAPLLEKYLVEKAAYQEKKQQFENEGKSFTDPPASLDELKTSYWGKTSGTVSVPRFKNGVVFWVVESLSLIHI